jgi:hypothetical protein
MFFNYLSDYWNDKSRSRTNFYEVYGWIIEDGIKKIAHVHINNRGFKKDLDSIVLSSEAKPLKSDDIYLNRILYGNNIESFLEKTNEQRTIEVDFLGDDILGMYDASTDTVYVLKGLETEKKSWVKEHEYAHRLMAYLGMPQSERTADAMATAKTGNNPYKYRNVAN